MEPGWYPDPFSNGGYIRWWDGQRWGASTSLETSAPTSDQPGLPIAMPPPPPPGRAGFGAPAYPGSTTVDEAANVPLAMWGSRAWAKILDSLIEAIITAPIFLWLLWPPLQRLLDAVPADGSAPTDQAMASFQTDVVGISLTLSIVSALVSFLYEVPQNVIWGRTLGKRVTGIRIRPRAQDTGVTWLQGTIRWATATIGSMAGYGVFTLLDYLWPLWDKPWRQAIHDKTARTVVVSTRR